MGREHMDPALRQAIEGHFRAEAAIDKIEELRPRWTKTPHERGQLQCLMSRHKIRVAIPGNGWGKTTTMAMALDMAIQKDDPFNPDLVPKRAVVAIWVCQKFQQMEILRRQLEEDVWTRPWEWNQTRHFYSWPNGGTLHIVSADSDWKHIQGIPVDYVVFDEHPERPLWNEFMWRRRGKRKTRYMVAATMTKGMTWFVKEVIQPWEHFHKEKGLTADEARVQQLHPHIWVWDRGGIHDNPSMDKEDIEHYESQKHASNKEVMVRLTGGYADFTGDSVFDNDSLDRQLKNMEDGTNGSLHLIDTAEAKLILPPGFDGQQILRKRIQGSGTGEKYVEWLPEGMVDGGKVTVWEPPEISNTYVMGADFAAGLVGRDYDCCIVLKKDRDGRCVQVAEARGWWGDANFAEIMYLMGCWYYNAFMVGERQFGLPTLRRLYDEYHYPYIFRGRNESTRSRRPSDLLGHHRSGGDTIIPNLRAALCRDNLTLKSRDLMEELRQYQYRPRNATMDAETAKSDDLITSAPSGMNDDMVMALGYAWHAARECGRFQMPVPDYATGTYGEIFQNSKILRGIKVKEKRWM